MACLGFQLVNDYIKGQAFPFSYLFLKKKFVRKKFLHIQTIFLDVHDNYYTTTVYIHYIFFLLFQFNIHENFISASSYALYIYVSAYIFLVD
jgi:hypothetical protein